PARPSRFPRGVETDSRERDRRVYLEQVALLYQQAVHAAVVNASLGALVTYVYWSHIPRWISLAWSASVAFAVLFSTAVIVAQHREGLTIENAPKWGAWRVAETTINGLAWGSSSVLIFPHASPTYQVFLLLILCGFAAGAVPVNAPRIETYCAYAVP